VQDTSWLSFHGILPTADRLTHFGMRVDPSCFCGQPKDLLHMFTSCHFAMAILDWFLIQLRKFRPSVTSLPAGAILLTHGCCEATSVSLCGLLEWGS
jgi:hypothetical protein